MSGNFDHGAAAAVLQGQDSSNSSSNSSNSSSSNSSSSSSNSSSNGQGADRSRLIAAGGIVGALAATSCCILPLVLSLAGLGGAWIANFRALAPYQPLFVIVAISFIGAGFYLSYRQPKRACGNEMACARPLPGKLVRAVLWLAALIVLAAVTFGVWFPYVLPFLP